MRACAEPGCPELAKSGSYCEKHRGLQPRWCHTEKTAARGYGAAHRRWRKAVLMRDPWCVDCLADGRHVVATDADHVDGNPFNRALENGRGLCRRCHNRRTHGRGKAGRQASEATTQEVEWTFE